MRTSSKVLAIPLLLAAGASMSTSASAGPSIVVTVPPPKNTEEVTGYATGLTGYAGSGVAAGGTNGVLQASTGFITPWSDPGTTACIDVGGGASAPGTLVGMWTCNGGANQSWRLTRSGQIVGIGNECIDVPHSSTASGTRVQLFPCNGGANQKWALKSDHTIRGIGGMCLSMPPGGNIYANPNQGMVLEIDTCNGSANQHWMVHGTAPITGYLNYCLDVAGSRTANGTTVDYWACNGGPNQKWTVTPDGQIVGLAGKCLDVQGGTSQAGATLVINDCSTAWSQIWNLQANGTLTSWNGLCLDLPHGQTNYLPQLYGCNGGANQKWAYTQPLTVPLYPQVESDWCWIASAKMIMDFHGDLRQSPSQCEIANRVQVDGSGGFGNSGQYVDCCKSPSWNSDTSGCNVGGASWRVLQDFGYGATCEGGVLSFTTIANEIAAGRPVITGVTWNNDGNHHVMVIVGTDVDSTGGDWLVINDPWGAGASQGKGDQLVMPYAVWANSDAHWGTFTNNGSTYGISFGGAKTCN